jgi:hypothetical protein
MMMKASAESKFARTHIAPTKRKKKELLFHNRKFGLPLEVVILQLRKSFSADVCALLLYKKPPAFFYHLFLRLNMNSLCSKSGK